MFVLIRTIIYATLFIGFFLIYIPASLLRRSGIGFPLNIEWQQLTGIVIGAIGTSMALWCIFSFAILGKGTPAPFDPPQRLVIRGPYRIVRNPMYLAAGVALTGAALFYDSWELIVYTSVLLVITHLLVVFYEEPVLKKTFGPDYDVYRTQTGRWLPKF